MAGECCTGLCTYGTSLKRSVILDLQLGFLFGFWLLDCIEFCWVSGMSRNVSPILGAAVTDEPSVAPGGVLAGCSGGLRRSSTTCLGCMWADSESGYESGSVPAEANPFPFSHPLCQRCCYFSARRNFLLSKKLKKKLQFINNCFLITSSRLTR